MAALDFTYRYAHPSEVVREAKGPPQIRLATCSATHERPSFFRGRIREPRLVGEMLVTLHDLVRAHFFLPRPALLDPIVTSNEHMLRLEGFSGCCGAYARVDLPADIFEDGELGRGTTNVDFNAPMRAALLRLQDSDEVRFEVGAESFALHAGAKTTVEKKVKLPIRWIKGLGEVQVCQSRLEHAFEVDGSAARQLLRSLPTSNPPKRPSYVVKQGKGLRLTQRPKPGAVKLAGLHRLAILEPLARRANKLSVWVDPDGGTTAWDLTTDAGRMFLVLSPEVYRGFSGEGQLLDSLSSEHYQTHTAKVRAQLTWQNQIDPVTLATQTGLTPEETDSALAALGARGLVGYDANLGAYFHRELPFDLEQVEALQPRLKNARKLLEAGGVLEVTAEGKARVQGTDVVHNVHLGDDDRCSCPWFSKHQGDRGPCKHILAARLYQEDGE